MPFQVGSACYPTAQQAAQASASAQVGAVVVHGGSAFVVDVGGVSDTSIIYRLQPAAGGNPVQITASYLPQPCNLLQIGDGLQLGWMVGAAWIAAYSVMFIARALRGESTQNGDS